MRRFPTLVILSLALVVGPQFGSRAVAQEATPPTGEVVPASECRIAPRTAEELARLVGTPVAASAAATPDVTEVDRITSEPIDEARNAVAPADNDTVEAVTATYRELVACLNAGDYVRVYALYTDDYLRRHFAEGARQLENFQATPVPEDERIGLISVASVQLLDDDRVVARVETLDPSAEGAVVIDAILVPEADRYRIDQETVVVAPTDGDAAASPMPETAEQTPAGPVEVASFDIYFEPEEVAIPANTDVTFTLPNEGVTLHNFAIDELGIDVDIEPGATEEVVINAPAGIYEYYCNVPGHKAAGMAGTLTVE
jgi:uncharacterized cupredoxin-like copper-binding protein